MGLVSSSKKQVSLQLPVYFASTAGRNSCQPLLSEEDTHGNGHSDNSQDKESTDAADDDDETGVIRFLVAEMAGPDVVISLTTRNT